MAESIDAGALIEAQAQELARTLHRAIVAETAATGIPEPSMARTAAGTIS